MSEEKKQELNKTSSLSKKNGENASKAVQMLPLLKMMIGNGASDLHITLNSPPAMRVHGGIVKVKSPPLNAQDIKVLLSQIMTASNKREFEKNLEVDFSFEIKNLSRFRVNVFRSRGAMAAVLRAIPNSIPDMDTLNLPTVIREMTNIHKGLILVTGPTGSGKSTTLASIIDHLNTKMASHIVTIEDPVEFVHPHKLSIVNQRELGNDTHSFQKGLKSLLRQDPDIVLVGELRDQDTIEAALTISETGHLVFGTLHTNSAAETISRLINSFPADKQNQIRTLLAFSLQGVISQQLIKKSFENGRVLSLEILSVNTSISNLIRENKLHQIYSQMQIGQDKSGMITMNQSLYKLTDKGDINKKVAMAYSSAPDELATMLGIDGDSKRSKS
ncbi:MAG: type IV pilus twitching motility protein PilT [Bacteriovoracales bacterium]|nr:type IV pilus twitching motility protein PilT [Bacteriovoracales bacterium]